MIRWRGSFARGAGVNGGFVYEHSFLERFETKPLRDRSNVVLLNLLSNDPDMPRCVFEHTISPPRVFSRGSRQLACERIMEVLPPTGSIDLRQSWFSTALPTMGFFSKTAAEMAGPFGHSRSNKFNDACGGRTPKVDGSPSRACDFVFNQASHLLFHYLETNISPPHYFLFLRARRTSIGV